MEYETEEGLLDKLRPADVFGYFVLAVILTSLFCEILGLVNPLAISISFVLFFVGITAGALLNEME